MALTVFFKLFKQQTVLLENERLDDLPVSGIMVIDQHDMPMKFRPLRKPL